MGSPAVRTNHAEVGVVDVGVDAEEALEDGLGDAEEVLGERHADFRRKEGLVIELRLDPGHQVVNVLCRRVSRGPPPNAAIAPGAEHLIGFFTAWPSAQWYSYLKAHQLNCTLTVSPPYLGPADMIGHSSGVQNSVMVP